MTRHRLPNRRRSATVEIEHEGIRGYVSAGLDDQGRVREVFVSTRRPGSALDELLADAAITASVALQHGAELGALACTLRRAHGSKPTSMLAAALIAVAPLDGGRDD